MSRWAVAAALALSLLWPATAGAHAQLEETRPARGEQLDAAPAQVEFLFSEGVQAGVGSVRVFDGNGREVQTGAAFHPGDAGARIAVRLRDGLPDGGYTATYRVVSADSHPVSGGFSFQVGTGGAGAQSVDRLLQDATTGPVTATALGTARGVQYAAIALALGAVFFLFALGPVAGIGPRLRRLLVVAGAAGLVASVLGIGLEGAQARGTSFWDAARPAVVGEVLDTRFGVTWALAALAWVVVMGVGARRRALLLPVAGLCLVPAFGGHASVESPLMLAANVVHVVCVGAWVGGLAVLLLALRPAVGALEPAERTAVLSRVVGRFSTWAGALVAVVLATGIVQSIIEVGAWSELTGTAYGRAILIKLGLFAVLLGFGAAQRLRVLPRLRAAAAARTSPGAAGVGLLRALRGEVAVAIVVLGVTGALATYAPAKVADVGPVSESTVIGSARMELTVDPATPGVNELHLYLFDRVSGTQDDRAKEVTATLRLRSRALELPVDLRKAGPGHYVANALAIPARGDWTLTVAARTSDFDEDTATLKVPVR